MVFFCKLWLLLLRRRVAMDPLAMVGDVLWVKA